LPGFGDLDIFSAKQIDNKWLLNRNEGLYLNSKSDDFGITFLPKYLQKPDAPIAFFTSNRMDGLGDDDIYSITVKPFVFLVKGKVLERETNSPISKSLVTVTNNNG